MDVKPINKYVTEENLNLIYGSIEELNKELNDLAVEIFNNGMDKKNISKPGHFTFLTENRIIELNKGFKILMTVNKEVATINLIRLQQDNCMRLFALGLVENRPDFYQRKMKGEQISNIKDAEGNDMTDSYLSEKLDVLYPGFKMLYNSTSDFI